MSELHYPGRKFGYARVSTDDQDTQLQIDALLREGVPRELIFEEKISGKSMDRPRLNAVLGAIRPGDTLCIWKLDRLGRSLSGIMEVVDRLHTNGIGLHSCTDGLDPETASGRLTIGILAALAQWERETISERTKAGMEASSRKAGRKHSVLSYEKRLAVFNQIWAEGRWPNGDLRARDVIQMLNDADPDLPPISGPAMLSNWKADGFPGFELPADKPLDDDV